mmetsp:Transcript_35913/g.43252  ORF Transcript_35913/g.43252 Transcript_35913/m.43252 type:complete len:214 (+) Transcript_35913:39-680(+)
MPLQKNKSNTVEHVPLAVQKARMFVGLCPTCGIQTQIIDEFGNLLSSVTNSNVFKSRCMRCNPWPKDTQHSQIFNSEKGRTRKTSRQQTNNCYLHVHSTHRDDKYDCNLQHKNNKIPNDTKTAEHQQIKRLSSSTMIGYELIIHSKLPSSIESKINRSFDCDKYLEHDPIIRPTPGKGGFVKKYNHTNDLTEYNKIRMELLRRDALLNCPKTE